MKIFILSFILFLFVGCQNSNKPKTDNDKTKTIEQKEEIGLKNGDYFTEEDSLFLAMINKKIVTKPEEKKYISRLDNLIPIQLIHCDNNSIHYKDSINGKSIDLTMKIRGVVTTD